MYVYMRCHVAHHHIWFLPTYIPTYILHIKVNFFLAFPPTEINYYNIIICCGVYENIIFFHFYDFKTTTTTTLKCAARYINICLRCCRLLAQKIRIGVVRYTTVCSAGWCDATVCVYIIYGSECLCHQAAICQYSKDELTHTHTHTNSCACISIGCGGWWKKYLMYFLRKQTLRGTQCFWIIFACERGVVFRGVCYNLMGARRVGVLYTIHIHMMYIVHTCIFVYTWAYYMHHTKGT